MSQNRTPLEVAVAALREIADPASSSLRHRDPNCTRYIASDALDQLRERGVYIGVYERWIRYDTVGGNIAGESEIVR